MDKNRQEKLRRKKLGLCTNCGGAPALVGFSKCSRCKTKEAERNKRVMEALDAQGLCRKCKTSPRAEGRGGMCDPCADHHNNNRKVLHAQRRAKGLCVVCGERSLKRNQYCFRHDQAVKKNKQALLARRDKLGLCIRCHNKRIGTTRYCLEHFFDNAARRYNWPDLRQALQVIWDRQQGKCSFCGEQMILGVETWLDHNVPQHKLLKERPEKLKDESNLSWMHRFCNERKGPVSMADWFVFARKVLGHNKVSSV